MSPRPPTPSSATNNFPQKAPSGAFCFADLRFPYPMKRFLFSLSFLAAALASVPAAHAATLEWQDISSVVPNRTARPVWDVAYASPYVYFTDGIDFAKGGYIARTDGVWSKNLTADSKATIGRVDALTQPSLNTVIAVESGHAVRADKTWTIQSEWPQMSSMPNLTKSLDAGTCILQNSLWTTPVKAPSDAFCRFDHNFLATWNGSSWYILIEHKTLYRLDPTDVVKIGRVRDYFTSMTSDGRGHVYFGGAVSTLESNQPRFPLVAKLVKMTDVDAVAALEQTPNQPPTIDPSSNKTAVWSWTAPTVSTIAQDGWTTYSVGAWNAKNITKIELYQDGSLLKTCTSSTQTATCTSDISAKTAAVGSTLSLKARVTDATGTVTETDTTTLAVSASTGFVALPADVDIAVSNELVPQVERIGRNGSIILRATARAKAGLKRIVFHVNGSPRSACAFSNAIGVQTCDFQVNGWDYPYNQVSSFTAQAIDATDHDAWAGVRQIRITDDTSTAASTNAAIWGSVAGNTYIVGANDPDGIARIDVYVNDAVRQSCTFSSGYGSRECSATFGTTDIVNNSVSLKGKIVDAYGHEAWTEPKSVSGSNVSNTTTQNTAINTALFSLNSSADNGFTAGQTVSLDAVADRLLGAERIEILFNQNVAKTCSSLTAGGSQQDVPVFGTVRVANGTNGSLTLAAGSYLTTQDGRSYKTLESATILSGSIQNVRVVSNGVGQSYSVALYTPFQAASIDPNFSSLVSIQAIDGFSGGRETVGASHASCSASITAPASESFQYGVRILSGSGKVLWTETKTVLKK